MFHYLCKHLERQCFLLCSNQKGINCLITKGAIGFCLKLCERTSEITEEQTVGEINSKTLRYAARFYKVIDMETAVEILKLPIVRSTGSSAFVPIHRHVCRRLCE